MTDILLFVLFLVSCIYCSDVPPIVDIPLLVHGHDSLAYNVGLSIIAAYIFYFIQTVPVVLKKKSKYGRFVELKLADIDSYMSDTLRIITRCACDERYEEIEQKLRESLSALDIFEDGARVYRDQKELVIIEALLENETRIHQEILELLSLNILGKRTVDLLMEVEQLEIRKFAQTYGAVKPGELETVEQRRHESAGGALSYNTKVLQRDLGDKMIQYVGIKKKVSAYREKFCGDGVFVLFHRLRV